MSRINEIANVTREAVAPRITINWNPTDNTGSVIFKVEHMESIDGEFQRMVPEGFLSISLPDLMARSFMVGETEVPTALVMGYIKAAFDTLYTERQAAVAAPIDPAIEETP